MSAASNRQVLLARRPCGIPQAEDFTIVQTPPPALGEGLVMVENQFLSVEPAMRGWLAATANYAKPIQVGDVMRSLASGKVVASRSDAYQPGDLVTGWFGWQDMAAVPPQDIVRKVTETDLPLSLSLGVLGLNGITAYLALTRAGEPRAGETVVVSTAAGAVGSVVGQVARLLGCKAIGITSSQAKMDLCTSAFGYTQAINYTNEDVSARLKEMCPEGLDVYFDNTSGPISDAVRANLAAGARIVVCGTASIASWEPAPTGPRVERDLLVKRARMQGFLAFDHVDRYEATIRQLVDWIRSGDLTWREDVLQGFESCPDAIAGLYRGENMGKRIVQIR
ncbi:MAG: NADP-dependent oxidoreductase [Pseudomonadota bacterium]